LQVASYELHVKNHNEAIPWILNSVQRDGIVIHELQVASRIYICNL